jgi:hypothetical protein
MTEPSGVEYQKLETAVQVLKALLAEARYAVLLTRMGAARFAGDPSDFRRSLSEKMGRDIDDQEAKEVLSEIKRFSRLISTVDDLEKALRFLEGGTFAEAFKKLPGETEKEELRATLRKKLRLVLDLLPPAFRDRKNRLRTATDASLEDVDIELVRERRDNYQASTLDQAFLRLRFRHTDGSGLDLPWYLLPSLSLTEDLPWPCKTFLLECDETDIDFLIFRLREAKRALSSAVSDSPSARQ